MVNNSNTHDPNIFYEEQLDNPELTWELMAQPWSETGSRVQAGPYRDTVLRGIIDDPHFGFAGATNFSSMDENGMLGTLVGAVNKVRDVGNSISGRMQDAEQIVDHIIGMPGKTDQWIRDMGDKLATVLEGNMIGDFVGGTIKKAANSIGSTFVTAFDYVSIFRGTQLDINFPAISTRIYNGAFWDRNGPISSTEMLKRVLDRFVGEVSAVGVSQIDSVIQMQAPPNNYIPSFKIFERDVNDAINNPIQGTFMLRYGKYRVPNLLVASFGYNISTIKSREGSSGEVCSRVDTRATRDPIYIDISVQVRPCNFMSKSLLSSILFSN